MRRHWIPSSVPLFVLLLALVGQVKEQVAVIALSAVVLVGVWSVGLTVALIWHSLRQTAAGPVLAGLFLAGAAVLAAVALVVEAPLWVRWKAAPAIAAIDESCARDGRCPGVGSLEGDFPRPLRAALEVSGHCLYKPRGPSYHLACLGVPFTKCGYDGATGRWTGWE
jgi:hypothetical protein